MFIILKIAYTKYKTQYDVLLKRIHRSHEIIIKLCSYINFMSAFKQNLGIFENIYTFITNCSMYINK